MLTITDSLTCLLGHHGMNVVVVDMWVGCCKERTVYIRRYRLVKWEMAHHCTHRSTASKVTKVGCIASKSGMIASWDPGGLG